MALPRSKALWSVLLGFVLAVNLAVGLWTYRKGAEEREHAGRPAEKLGVMLEALRLIHRDYVDADNVTDNQLMENALRGMLSTLDPFSSYLSPDEFQEMREMTEGHFGGLGITVMVRHGRLTVIAPMEGSPAAKAGILAGDQIVKIGEENAETMGMDEAMRRLHGEVGEAIALTLYRPSTKNTIALTLVRAEINVPSVTEVQMLDAATGYLRIREFSDNTAPLLETALRGMEEKKAKSLVIDLRNNPGGVLDSAVDACAFFLPPKSLVVYTEGGHEERENFRTNGGYKAPRSLRLVILINQGSASAAEIMSACLQDWGRAVLLGDRSFGKASVQSLLELGDGGALKLTTAHYYTPSRRIIHEHGVEPDVVLALTEKEQESLAAPDEETGELPKPSPAKDRQLKAAVELLRNHAEFDAKCRKRFRDAAAAPKTVRAPEQPAAAAN